MVDTDDFKESLNILVVDDEANIRKVLKFYLESEGHIVTAVGNPADATVEAEQRSFQMAFVDLRLGISSGLDLIPALLASSPWIHIVVITAYASIDTAVEAMRRGAKDSIPKPFTPEQVASITRRVIRMAAMERRIASLEEELQGLHPAAIFSSRHPAMERAIALAKQIAPSEAMVLLRGASGTGKTEMARAIHRWSRRSTKPPGIVSCPTLSPDLLESELFGHKKGAFT